MPFHFPFGQELKPVLQQDRTAKKLFVLGVYASAVHAQWTDAKGKLLVNALAVASEPYIFWRGEDAEEIISKVKLPDGVGALTAASASLNGPSGKALDKLFLAPFGIDRSEAWLCDLLPESRMNPSQAQAIQRAYIPLQAHYGLPTATVPLFDKKESDTSARRKQIMQELVDSEAERIVVLGDVPIQQFIRPLSNTPVRNLAHLTELAGGYGAPWRTELDGRPVEVIGLCHPRQAARLGSSSAIWGARHDAWRAQMR
jgi:hypothetical protein